MKQNGQFLLFTREEFKKWLFDTKFSRPITLIQNHHTYLPDYSGFNGKNHFDLLNSMKSYHVNETKFSDIAQNITTFKDGIIALCRTFEKEPAGIMGANSGALCIEHVGNFDLDIMTEEHKKTIIFLNAILCIKFNIHPCTDNIVYHHWYDLNTGERTNSEGILKSCPGRLFFGGNTVENANKNFIPLIKNQINNMEEDNMNYYKTINDVPDYAKPTIQKLINHRTLKGNDIGEINVSEDFIRIFVVLDREGLIK